MTDDQIPLTRAERLQVARFANEATRRLKTATRELERLRRDAALAEVEDDE